MHKTKLTVSPYKALMLDCDGTIIPNKRDGKPSQRVKTAIKKAKEKGVFVGLATGRPLFILKDILDTIEPNAPCIVMGGAQIIDPKNYKILKEQYLQNDDLIQIHKVSTKHKTLFYVNCADDQKGELYSTKRAYKNILGGVFISLQKELGKEIEGELSKIPTLSVHTVNSWTSEGIDILYTHTNATKQHGILEVAKILGINTHEIIGVGDGYNDFPLLMACGLRIAMDNAVPELKEIADYIAPSVDDDGVADVIEKYILNT